MPKFSSYYSSSFYSFSSYTPLSTLLELMGPMPKRETFEEYLERRVEEKRIAEQQQAEEARIAKEKAEAFVCRRCHEKYPSNTKLHDHVREKHTKPEKPTPQAPTTPPTPPTPLISPSPAPSAPVSPVSSVSPPHTSSSPPPPTSIEPAASPASVITSKESSPAISPTTPRKPILWAEIASRPKQPISRSRLPRPTITITHGLSTSSSTPPSFPQLAPILLPSELVNSSTSEPSNFETPYFIVEDLYVMFHEKSRPASLAAIQKRLSIAHAFGPHMRLHQMRITSYFKSVSNGHDITPSHTRKWKPIPCLIAGPRSPSFSINEKADRPNSATPGLSHGSPTHPPSTSASGYALASNRKSAESGFMCQTTGIEAEKLKNRGVASNRFSRQCRHCKQFFTSGNLLHRHIPHCNKGIKGFKRARKLDGPWRKASN